MSRVDYPQVYVHLDTSYKRKRDGKCRFWIRVEYGPNKKNLYPANRFGTDKLFMDPRLALESAIREAELFQRLPETVIPAILQNANKIGQRHSLPDLDIQGVSPKEIKEYFQNREKVLDALEEKLKSYPPKICRFTPIQFEHLVTTVQAGYRNAVIFSEMENEEIKEGITGISGFFTSLGLEPWTHFEVFGPEYKQFFAREKELLYAILEAINQLYDLVSAEDTYLLT